MLDRPTPQVTMTLGETRVQIDIPASEFLRDTPRSDGYEPLAYKLWEWHRAITTITKNKLHVATFRYLWNVTRRLDVAHRQFEVVRAGIDRAAKLESDRIACRRQMFEVLGDTELAVIALSRALQLVLEIPRRFPTLRVPVPRIVKRQAPAVLALRANCEHLEVNELQRPLADKDNQLIAVFRAIHLFEERRVAGETYSLDIDAEATGLLVHARGYLMEAITRLTRRPPTPPAALPATKRRR
jgi:hypothetical protein